MDINSSAFILNLWGYNLNLMTVLILGIVIGFLWVI